MSDRRFHRVLEFIGEEAFCRLRETSVTVVGLGGVGAHAAMALARSGIGRLILVDFDLVTETSLNRSPVAVPGDVGRLKVDMTASAISEACPDTAVETVPLFFHHDTADRVLGIEHDFVVDAIDSLNPKVHLLERCVSERIPVFSSMGASGRRDPSLVRTGDISRTGGCPLARQVRKYLRKRGVTSGIACVWSVEPSGDHALPPDGEDITLERGRRRNRIPGSVVMPGIFGYAVAGMVLDSIMGLQPTGE